MLDLDNTLYDYHSCHKSAMGALIEELTQLFSTDEDSALALYKSARQLVHDRLHGTAVSHSRLFYLQYMVEKLSGKTSTATILKLYRTYWDTFIKNMELFDDAIPFLQLCLHRNVPVVLVTDMTAEVQFDKLKKLGIEDYLAYVVTSEEAGIEKPHPFIFEYAVNKALRQNKDIKNIAVVGDDIKKDLHFSEVYQMHTYHITRK